MGLVPNRLGGLVLGGCSNRDSRTILKNGGGICSSHRYMIHLYCLAVQAGFYSDVVECWPVTHGPGLIPGRGIGD